MFLSCVFGPDSKPLIYICSKPCRTRLPIPACVASLNALGPFSAATTKPLAAAFKASAPPDASMVCAFKTAASAGVMPPVTGILNDCVTRADSVVAPFTCNNMPL